MVITCSFCFVAQPNKSHRADLKRIARAGFGISEREARQIGVQDGRQTLFADNFFLVLLDNFFQTLTF